MRTTITKHHRNDEVLRGMLLSAPLLASTLLLAGPLLGQQPSKGSKRPPAKSATSTTAGRTLFTKNCAVCHGATATGGDGPNLHHLKLSSSQIVTTITKGVKGEMPPFGNKLKTTDIQALATYLTSLKR